MKPIRCITLLYECLYYGSFDFQKCAYEKTFIALMESLCFLLLLGALISIKHLVKLI